MLCVLWFSGVSDETFSCFVQGRRVQLPSLMNGPSYKGYMRNRNVVQTIFFFFKRATLTCVHNGENGLKMPYKIQVRKIAIITVQISRLAKRISVLTEAMVEGLD